MKVRKALPKLLGRLEPVFHSAARDGGLAPLRIVSIFANRPASASAIPCLKNSGIQESSFSTTNFVTFARTSAGRAFNCSITSAALMRKTYNRPHRGAIPPTEAGAMESRAFSTAEKIDNRVARSASRKELTAAQRIDNLFTTPGRATMRRVCAGIAQLVEQLICNQQVVGSNPTAGSLVDRWFYEIAESLAWTLLLFRGHEFAVARYVLREPVFEVDRRRPLL